MSTPFSLANLPVEVLRNLPLDTAATLNICCVNKFFNGVEKGEFTLFLATCAYVKGENTGCHSTNGLFTVNIYRNVDFSRNEPRRLCRFAKTIAAKKDLGAFVESFHLRNSFPAQQFEVTIDQTDALAKSYEGRVEVRERREYAMLMRE